VLLVIGESINVVEKFGDPEKRLLDQPELKPLAKYADRRLTLIGYLSKPMHARLAPTKKVIQSYLELANAWIPQANLPAEKKAQLKKDLAMLAKELEAYVPEVGATLGFRFMTARGMESFFYDWSQNLRSDASKTLTLLDHVGGDPLVAAVGRS